jgi:hypothetical protein
VDHFSHPFTYRLDSASKLPITIFGTVPIDWGLYGFSGPARRF